MMHPNIGEPEPVAKAAIDDAAAHGDAVLVMSVDGFITDAEACALRNMLWYARGQKVVVTFAPPAK